MHIHYKADFRPLLNRMFPEGERFHLKYLAPDGLTGKEDFEVDLSIGFWKEKNSKAEGRDLVSLITDLTGASIEKASAYLIKEKLYYAVK